MMQMRNLNLILYYVIPYILLTSKSLPQQLQVRVPVVLASMAELGKPQAVITTRRNSFLQRRKRKKEENNEEVNNEEVDNEEELEFDDELVPIFQKIQEFQEEKEILDKEPKNRKGFFLFNFGRYMNNSNDQNDDLDNKRNDANGQDIGSKETSEIESNKDTIDTEIEKSNQIEEPDPEPKLSNTVDEKEEVISDKQDNKKEEGIIEEKRTGWFGFGSRKNKSATSADSKEEEEKKSLDDSKEIEVSVTEDEKDDSDSNGNEKENEVTKTVLDKEAIVDEDDDLADESKEIKEVEESVDIEDKSSNENKMDEEKDSQTPESSISNILDEDDKEEEEEVSLDSNQDDTGHIQEEKVIPQNIDDVLSEMVKSIAAVKNDILSSINEESNNSTNIIEKDGTKATDKMSQDNSTSHEEVENKNKDPTRAVTNDEETPIEKPKPKETRVERAWHNVFAWKKKKRSDDDDDNNEIESSLDKPSLNETKTPTPVEDQTPVQAPPLQQAPPPPPVQPMPMPMGSSPSLIFIPPPPPRSMNRSAPGMPTGPVSPAEATLTSLISSLLPLVVRLLLLSLLSSSSLFGHGGMHVHSPEPSQHFVFERLNDRYYKDNLAMKKALEHPPDVRYRKPWKFVLNRRRNEMKKWVQARNEKTTTAEVSNPIYSRTVIVMDVDTMGSMDETIENLRDAVSYILHQFNGNARLDMGTDLEIIACIESPGGIVQDFGLAADQLARLTDTGKENGGDLILTVCVDKIAASGGYMMACQASPGQLIAAPFAILGSIGVLRETINVHDVLEKYGKF
jgi:hypothetical protein